MILVIRIAGLVEIAVADNETLHRICLRRKYTATLMKETDENMKLLQHIRNFVAYGPIDPTVLKELIMKRGQIAPGKKVDLAKVATELDKKSLVESGLKPFFRLHPPRGGIRSKLHYPQGVLGDNKHDINDLVRSML